VVGAPGRAEAPLGAAFVVFGRQTPPAAPIPLGELPAAGGYRIADSEAGSGAGWSVAGLGDLSGDGVPESIVGAIGARWRTGSGAAYVVYGRRNATGELDLARLRPADGYVLGGLPDAGTGWSVADAGDVDGDGMNEAWVWAPDYAATTSTLGTTFLVGLPRPAATPQTRRTGVGRGRLVSVAVRCTAARGTQCAGAVRLIREGRIVASAGFSLPAAANRSVTLRLSPGTARLLRRRGRLRVTVRAVATAEPPAPSTVHSRRLLLIRR
jgi:hypothetical protein